MKIVFLLVALSCVAKADNLNTHTTGGRFQLIQLSNLRRDQFLLDTQTGLVRSYTCMVPDGQNCGYGAWLKDDVEDINLNGAQIMRKANSLKDDQKKSPAN